MAFFSLAAVQVEFLEHGRALQRNFPKGWKGGWSYSDSE